MKRLRAIEREVVILGGGLVGLLTALLVKEETNLDVCLYADDSPEPRTDSQRNHAWLQSGLLYVGANIQAARHMYLAGREMHRMLSFEPPTHRGVFRYTTEAAAQSFLDHAAAIRLDHEVVQLSESQARTILGSFFEKRRANYEVPDCPFDIAGLMNEARARAREHGATFHLGHVDVEVAAGAPNGYRLRVSNELIESKHAVVCTGPGTPAILENLGLPHPLVINRSGLLVLPRADSMTAALLADRSREISVVRHTSIPPHGRIVVGDKGRVPVRSRDGLRRCLTRGERQELLTCIPASVLWSAGRIRATACHKTDVRRVDGRATVEPWVETYAQYPGLVFATPGKATMALYTAREILKRIRRAERGKQRTTPQPLSEVGSTQGTPEWRDPIRTHFHPDFDEMDDTESDETNG